MKNFLQRKRRLSIHGSWFLALPFLALLVGQVFAQSGTWSLNPTRPLLNLARSAPPLQVKSEGMSSLRSFGFVGNVGGVAFEGVAEASEEIKGKKVSLSYDANRPDGRRLSVVIGDKSYEMSIPDWRLKPITLFADSEYTGVVSLFGEGPDRDKYYYIQYHESFQNTLLGLRLLQADIIFIDLKHHWKLPEWNGKVVLGAGETMTNQEKAEQAAQRLSNALRGKKWRSWVLTDIGTEATVVIKDGKLAISNSPYYYFWDMSETVETAHKKKIDDHNQIVADLRTKQRAYNELVGLHRSEVNGYNAKVGKYNASNDPTERDNLKTELDSKMTSIQSINKKLEVLHAEIKNTKKSLDMLRAEINDLQVEEVTDLTSAIRQQDADILAYNPSVYHAYQQTAKFTALLRYAKKVSDADWRRFVGQMKRVDISPDIQTPTAWPKTPVTKLQR
jgi:hypothetical protein